MKPAFATLVMAVTILGALGACQTTSPQGDEPALSAPTTDPWAGERHEIFELLAYFQRLLAMAPDELRREYHSVNQLFLKDRSEQTRLRLALLLAVPGTGIHEDARLLALLEASGSRLAAPESPRRQLATVLSRHASERQKLLGQLQRAEAQLKDELRRSEGLQRKLDALLTIDREMRSRRRAIP